MECETCIYLLLIAKKTRESIIAGDIRAGYNMSIDFQKKMGKGYHW